VIRRARVLVLSLVVGLAGCGKSSNVTAPPNAPAQWTRASGISGNVNCTAIAVSGSTFLGGTVGAGVFRSTDGGPTWARFGTGPMSSENVPALAAIGTTLLAGSTTTGVWKYPL